jgi:hypothetical protein
MGLKRRPKSEKPPSAFAGGGLDNARLLNPVRQAPLPACVLDLLIRGSETGKAMHGTGEKLALEVNACMTLIAVEQRCKVRVKTEAQGQEGFEPHNTSVTFDLLEPRML